jgi:hypothetical protein
LIKRGSKLPGQRTNLRSPLAISEHCACQPGKATENRPIRHLALGYEYGRCQGTQEQNIQIAQMIGDEESQRWNWALGLDMWVENL